MAFFMIIKIIPVYVEYNNLLIHHHFNVMVPS